MARRCYNVSRKNLKSFLINIRQDTDCDLNSKHPIITALFSLREELLQELDACVASENPVYRQSANLASYFHVIYGIFLFQYAFLCDEMHDFYNRAKDVANKIIGLDITALKNFREIQLNEAQLKTFVISATSFKQVIFFFFSL